MDIDPRNAPDYVASICDMSGVIEDGSFDAIWSSHCIEHLHDHEVLPVLREFKRILREDGFAIVACPNMDAIAKLLVSEDIEFDRLSLSCRSDPAPRHDLRPQSFDRGRACPYGPQDGLHGGSARPPGHARGIRRSACARRRKLRPLGRTHDAESRIVGIGCHVRRHECRRAVPRSVCIERGCSARIETQARSHPGRLTVLEHAKDRG